MNNRYLKYLRFSFTFLFGLAATLFFGYGYKYHLRYIEGMQLFLYTWDYVKDMLLHPGGLAELISRFLVQFYHVPLIGGAIIGLLLVLLQTGIQAIVNSISDGYGNYKNGSWWFLTFVPPAFYWYLMCDSLFTLTGLTALTAAVWICFVYSKLPNKTARTTYAFVWIPLLWFTAGGVAVAAALLMLAIEILNKSYRKWLPFAGMIAGVLLTWVLIQASPFQYEPIQLFLGGIYYTYLPDIPLLPFLFLWMLTVVTVVVTVVLPSLPKKWISAAIGTVAVVFFFFVIKSNYDRMREKEYFYLFSAKEMKWRHIIDKSHTQLPNSLLAVNMLNLALAMTGSEGDQMFHFPQPTQEALVLSYEKDMLFAQEILFNLGLINESRRYAYECLSQIPDKQQSAYFLKRIAEADMISGRETLARKYLSMLQKTLFYRSWAGRRLRMLDTEDGIDNHPVYGSLKQIQPIRNFNYTVLQFEKILLSILQDNPRNQMAYRYLMMYYMLTKNIPAFYENLRVTHPVPRHYREALVFSLGFSDDAMFEEFKTFEQQLQSLEPSVLEENFGKTYWYYFYLIQ